MEMTYIVVDDNNIITNIIVADATFAAQIDALPYYDGAVIGQPYAPPHVPTDRELLEQQITQLQLEAIAQGQRQTALELETIKQGRDMTALELEVLHVRTDY